MTRVVLVVLLAVGLVAGWSPRPAAACSCVGGGLEAIAEFADVAVLGTIVGVERRDGGWFGEPSVRYEVQVEASAKQPLPRTVQVRSADGSAACGVEARVGARVAWGLRDDGDELVASLCQTAPPDELEEVADLRPVAAPQPDPDDPPGLDESPLLPIGGALLAVAALLGAVVWLDRR